MKNVSLAMIVKNEEKYIQRCLESVKPFVNEMIVVDTGSIDKTVEIAKEMGAVVYHFDWVDDFSKARNFSLSKVTGDWVLVLDADEYVTGNIKNELKNHMEEKQEEKQIGRIKIVSRFMDEKDSVEKEAISYVSRFFPKGIEFEGRIHEQLNSELKRVKMNVEVKHDGYFEADKSERNLPLLLKELEEKPNDPYIQFQLARGYKKKQDVREATKYYRNSYKELTKNESYAPELIMEYLNCLKDRKLYENATKIIQREESLMWNIPDFHYFIGLFYMEYQDTSLLNVQTRFKIIEGSFLTCIKLGEEKALVKGVGSYLAEYNLGVFYEVLGERKRANHLFRESYSKGFKKAKERIK